MSTKRKEKAARAVGGGRVVYPNPALEAKIGAAMAKSFPRMAKADPTSNRKLVEIATEAIEAVFSDTSVSRQQCRDNLHELKDDIETKINCLDADDEREET